MNTDLSVAPEIAQLAAPPALPPQGPGLPLTAGRLAGELALLAAEPQRWWDLVRFDPDGPVRVTVPGTRGAWLLVVPPGAAADCDCAYATLIAGEAADGGRLLRPGRVLLHRTGPHRFHGTGCGYSVSLHSH